MSTHNNAIRASYAAVSQTDISGKDWGYVAAETTSRKVFEMKIEDNRVVKANCKVLVIIAAKDANYNDKYEVVNTTMCDLGESKPFEYR
jgi:phage gp45-like